MKATISPRATMSSSLNLTRPTWTSLESNDILVAIIAANVKIAPVRALIDLLVDSPEEVAKAKAAKSTHSPATTSTSETPPLPLANFVSDALKKTMATPQVKKLAKQHKGFVKGIRVSRAWTEWRGRAHERVIIRSLARVPTTLFWWVMWREFLRADELCSVGEAEAGRANGVGELVEEGGVAIEEAEDGDGEAEELLSVRDDLLRHVREEVDATTIAGVVLAELCPVARGIEPTLKDLGQDASDLRRGRPMKWSSFAYANGGVDQWTRSEIHGIDAIYIHVKGVAVADGGVEVVGVGDGEGEVNGGRVPKVNGRPSSGCLWWRS
ncbi:hypothetical protein Fmac_006714 [Flemingia macrophylla]|uniref:Uncharacterized protein n=1 Tax=Flemingia macrophylla TaxID=520843 RepID=A0ABD1NBD5_9FABA